MKPNFRRAALGAGLALILSGATFAPTLAQPAYPNKPVRIIVPSTPAGVLDNVARTLALRLADQLGQPIVIDNKGGAGGNIGAEAAARAPADGYTLFIGFNATHGANLALFGKLSYDPVGDFAPISLLAAVPNIISVHPSVPVNSLSELVALAKARPGQLSYASSGNAAVLKVMALPETRERMAGFGAEITTSTPDEFAAHIRSEMTKLGKVIRDAKIKVN